VKKSSTAVMTGCTTLLGSKPYLNAIKFKKVEHGMEIDKVKRIEMIGIKINIPTDKE
jgi:hypothetical protein